MFYVYILQSAKDQKFYIGQTNNLEDRLKRHTEGRVKATKGRRPVKLVTYQRYKTRAEAMVREKYLKSLKGGEEWKKILKHWGVAKW